MNQATCSSCRAAFDVAFDPGTEFTCGACGAVVVVPSPPKKAAPPRRAPAAAPREAARAPAPRHDRPRAAPGEPAATASGAQRKILFAVVGLTAVIVVVIAILFMTSGGGGTKKAAPADPNPLPAATGPAAAGATPAATPTPETKTEPEKPATPRPSDPLEAARWDAGQSGAGALAFLKLADMLYDRADALEADGSRDEAARLRKESLDAYASVVKLEKNQERARDRLGFVRFDPAEAKALAAMPGIPARLKSGIEEVIEIVEDKTKGKQVAWPLWMSVKGGSFEDVAADWRKALRRAKAFEALQEERVSDVFYERATRMAAGVEGDVGPVLRKRKVQGATFDVYPNKPYVVLVQRDADYDTQAVAEAWTDLLLQLRETFVTRFKKLGLAPMDRPTPLLILRFDTDYVKYLRRGDTRDGPASQVSSQAHFEPYSKRLVVWKDPDSTDSNRPRAVSEDEVRTVLFHEGTHQLVDYYTKTRASNLDESLWFSEGIADYFGGHGRAWDETAGVWRYEPGLINEERVRGVGEAKAGGYLFKLRDLLAYRRGDYERDKHANAPKTLTAYAQGWALVYFLSNWNDQKYRDKFDQYVRKELNGESGVAAFEAVFGAAAVDEIEKELHAMIDVLFQAAKDKRIVNGKLRK